MEKIFFLLGGLSAGLAVALGAFGSHALKNRLKPEDLATFETGVRYQIYHSLALLAAGLAAGKWTASIFPDAAGWLFLVGILLFSGSLYLLVITKQRAWGAITPLGGLAFIVGWICLAVTPFL
jgi:uncharacterized membrane protein YgdD (TMEM256/DUF423 family)